MNLNLILFAALALCITGTSILYNRYAAASKRATDAEAQLEVRGTNEKVVTKYVDRIVTVEKRVPVAVAGLERLCIVPGVPSPASPDAATAPDAHNGQLAALAADIGACRENAEQLSALQSVLSSQVQSP